MVLCEKALPSNCYVGPCSQRQFLVRLWVHPVIPPTSPSNVVTKKSTHFHPFCSKFNFVWGGWEEVTSFSNITGKVPTLLTFIVVIPVLQIIPFIPSILVAPFFPFILLFLYCIARFIRLNTKQCWLAVFTTNHMWGGLGV